MVYSFNNVIKAICHSIIQLKVETRLLKAVVNALLLKRPKTVNTLFMPKEVRESV